QREVRNPIVVADALEVTAEVAVASGCPAYAPRFLAVAAAMREAAHTAAIPTARRRTERIVSAARSTLGRPAFDAATVAGRALTIDDALALAIEVLAEHQSGTPALTGSGSTVGPVIAPPASPVVLTERQRQVLRLLVDGHSDPEIADTLGISTRTVETHVAGILNKIGVHARTAAVA